METFEEFMTAMKALREENEKGFAEIREQQKTNEEKRNKELSELKEYVYAVNSSVEGMKKNSGDVAEDYFYNSLNVTKTLGKVHFDLVERNWKSSIPLENGKTLDGEYDIALINKDSLGIVEVKYTVEKEDVENLVKKQVENFKHLFPMYADYKFYLGIGSMSFNRQAKDEAKARDYPEQETAKPAPVNEPQIRRNARCVNTRRAVFAAY